MRSRRSWRLFAAAAIFLLPIVTAVITAAAAPAGEERWPALVPAETLLGAPVRTPAGTRVGTVAGVLIAFESGRIGYVLIASGESPGRKVAVPWRAVRLGPVGREVMLTVDAERFREAPFSDGDVGGPGSAKAIHDFFGVSPHWQDAPYGSPRRPSPPRGLRIVR